MLPHPQYAHARSHTHEGQTHAHTHSHADTQAKQQQWPNTFCQRRSRRRCPRTFNSETETENKTKCGGGVVAVVAVAVSIAFAASLSQSFSQPAVSNPISFSLSHGAPIVLLLSAPHLGCAASLPGAALRCSLRFPSRRSALRCAAPRRGLALLLRQALRWSYTRCRPAFVSNISCESDGVGHSD